LTSSATYRFYDQLVFTGMPAVLTGVPPQTRPNFQVTR
jgi:hypothetical protein